MPQHKQKIADAFGLRAADYDAGADLQKEIAGKLEKLLPQRAERILEIGCGTGFLTENLLRLYPDSDIVATDIAKGMVDFCKKKFKDQNISFKKMDGEQPDTKQKYDLIVSSMAMQWFENPLAALEKYRAMLAPDGAVFYASLGPKSFETWTKTFEKQGVESGFLPLPSLPGVLQEEEITKTYPSTYEFLLEVRSIGAHTPRRGYKPLSTTALKRAMAAHDSETHGRVTWHIVYGCLKN